MADISQVKLPNGDTYNLVDENALPLTGGQVTGPVTFGDSVSADELTVGDLVVNGAGSFTNNLQVNTINGVTVGETPKFTDTVVTKTSQLINDSGYKKFHMVEASIPIMGGTPTINTAYSQILSWIEAGEEVIIVNTSLDDKRYYYWGKSDTVLLFMSLWGQELDIYTDNIRHFESPWLTLDTLPIYDGTVE